MLNGRAVGSEPRKFVRALSIVLIIALVAIVPTSRGTDGTGGCPGLNCPTDSGGPETTIVIVDTQPNPDLFGIIAIIAGIFF